MYTVFPGWNFEVQHFLYVDANTIMKRLINISVWHNIQYDYID